MRKNMWKQAGTMMLAAAMAVVTPAAGTMADEKDVTTISLYPGDGSLSSGAVGGYLGDFFASKGFEVEVWAYSDEKTNAILASGDLPDVMYVTAENLQIMIDSGMVLQLDDYLDQMPHVQADSEILESAFNYIRKYRSNGTGNIYCMPTSVGKAATGGLTDRNCVKLNWSVYEEIGAPEITSLDDLIPLMQQMMEERPADADGNPYYGTVLNNGSDAKYWNGMTLWYRWHAYQEGQLAYLLEEDMVNGTYTSILEENSLYYQGLKWYNKAYQTGVLDPDSISNDRATQKPKVDQGYTMVPSGTLPGWHDKYYEYYVPGTSVYYTSENKYGATNNYLVVNANTDKLDACLAFLDMLADPDAQIYGSMGPEGDYWYTTEDGHLYLTDKAKEHLEKKDGSKYIYDNGEEAYLWNTAWILNTGENTTYLGYDEQPVSARHSDWAEEMQYTNDTDNFNSWRETTGYDSWYDWLEAENAWCKESPLTGVDQFCSIPDDMMQLTIDAIRETVVTASWKMVYAETDEEFDSLWNAMVSDCEGLGAQDIIDWRLEDIENAKAIRDALE